MDRKRPLPLRQFTVHSAGSGAPAAQRPVVARRREDFQQHLRRPSSESPRRERAQSPAGALLADPVELESAPEGTVPAALVAPSGGARPSRDDGDGGGHENDKEPAADDGSVASSAPTRPARSNPRLSDVNHVLAQTQARFSVRPLPVALKVVAHAIEDFCNAPSVAQSSDWRIEVPLREDVLPATKLELSLSTHWLLLEFSTGDAAARQLLASHVVELEQLLAQRIRPLRQVSVRLQ